MCILCDCISSSQLAANLKQTHAARDRRNWIERDKKKPLTESIQNITNKSFIVFIIKKKKIERIIVHLIIIIVNNVPYLVLSFIF